MTETLSFRAAEAADLATLIDLCHRHIDASYRSFLGDQATEDYLESGAVARYVEENLPCSTVLTIDGKVAGLSVAKDDLIDLSMVDPLRDRPDLDRLLLDHTAATLFREYPVVRLLSFAENDAANRFYRQNGWSERRRFFDDASQRYKIEFVRELD